MSPFGEDFNSINTEPAKMRRLTGAKNKKEHAKARAPANKINIQHTLHYADVILTYVAKREKEITVLQVISQEYHNQSFSTFTQDNNITRHIHSLIGIMIGIVVLLYHKKNLQQSYLSYQSKEIAVKNE